ncbi:helix-turn-helix DNA binding domain protein [Mycobacterium Phage TribleTrouble]|nr:helix-turn-helix DNA binding domain protein [Mycobacterium Phage TribleTrouble]
MSVQETSLQAYDSIQSNLGTKQREVLDALKAVGPLCNADLAELLGWPINSVTPRVRELVQRGRVAEAHRGPGGATGRTVIFWSATTKG